MSNIPTPKTSKQLKQDMIEELSKEGFDTNILSDDSGDLGLSIRSNNDNVKAGGRISLIVLWPIMLVFYIYHFLKNLIR